MDNTVQGFLKNISRITIPASSDGLFVPRQHFVVSQSTIAPRKIRTLSPSFQVLLDRAKVEDPEKEKTVLYGDLTADYHKPLIGEFGGTGLVEVSFRTLSYLIDQQGRGNPGVLLNKGAANVFYVKVKGIVYPVGVSWAQMGWNFNATSDMDTNGWSKDDRVFLPKLH